jgi:DnaK suppressor protein
VGKRKLTAVRKSKPAAAAKPAQPKAKGKADKDALVKASKPARPTPTPTDGRRTTSKPAKPAPKSKSESTASSAGANGRSAAADNPPRLAKTHLNDAELNEFRELLMEKRRELVGDVNHLQNEAMRQGSSGESSGSSSMPIHMADIGTDTWEQELTLGLIENERGLLREIEEALQRIDDRTYGICTATNKPISKSRLRAKPWAKHCIEYARKRELGLA